jgi:hypothetical protein
VQREIFNQFPLKDVVLKIHGHKGRLESVEEILTILKKICGDGIMLM